MSDRTGVYITHAQEMFLMNQIYSVKKENAELSERIAELEKQNAKLVAENERIRVCDNCGDDNCSYGSQYGLLCTANNNLKHWKPKEQK